MKTTDLIAQSCSTIMLKMEIEKVEIYLQSLKNELNERKLNLITIDEVNLKLDKLKKEFNSYLDDIHNNYSTTGEDEYNNLWNWILTNFRLNLNNTN